MGNVFLVCYSVISKDSYSNVTGKWVPEISHHAPNVPMLLIGTKSDLRNDNQFKSNLVSSDEGTKLAKEIGAISYIECSALTQDNLKSVFDEAIKAALAAIKKKQKKKREDVVCCNQLVILSIGLLNSCTRFFALSAYFFLPYFFVFDIWFWK